METKKVCYVIGTLEIGGAERQLFHLVRLLDRSRFIPVVIALRGGRMKEEFESTGAVLHIVGKKWKLDLTFFMRLVSIIRKEKPDILHTWMFTSNTWGRLAGLCLRVPAMVASERSMDLWKKPYHYFLDWILARHTDKIIFNSEKVADFYQRKLHLSKESVKVVYNGLDTAVYRNISDTGIRFKLGIGDSKFVLAGGRLSPEKGLEYFLHAAAQVHQKFPDIRFVITGEGPEREKLMQIAGNLGISNLVYFPGYVKDFAELVSSAEMVVLSSLWEGMPNIIIEAMAAGKPVIATSVGGCKEIVHEGENGFLVQPRDPDALAKKMMLLLQKPDLCKMMGANGFLTVAAGFSLDGMVKKYEEIYDAVLSESA